MQRTALRAAADAERSTFMKLLQVFDKKNADEVCPYCRAVPGKDDSVMVCPTCKTAQHADCWRDNGDKCSVYGCKTSQPAPLSQDYVRSNTAGGLVWGLALAAPITLLSDLLSKFEHWNKLFLFMGTLFLGHVAHDLNSGIVSGRRGRAYSRQREPYLYWAIILVRLAAVALFFSFLNATFR